MLKKRCGHCRKKKVVSSFGKNRSTPTGLSSWCLLCTRAISNADYATPEGKARIRRQQQLPRGRYRRLVYSAKHGRKRRSIELRLTFEEYVELIKQPCFYCGDDLPTDGSGLDRKDNTKGYVKENLVPCCEQCNKAKSSFFTVEEMQLLGVVIREIKAARRLRAVA